LQELR
jgi:hypothetical protein